MMPFNDIWIFILWFLTTWTIYTFVVGVRDGYSKVTAETKERVIQHINDIVHRVEVVKEKHMTYWFDMDDGEFLGQGSTMDEMTDHVKHRFPDHFFVFTIGDVNYIMSQANDWHPEELAAEG